MEFQWDAGNNTKNWERHRVSCEEAEQCFFCNHIVVPDEAHSQKEPRYFLYGSTEEGRLLTLVFTVREKRFIRVISARSMNKKERQFYEKNQKSASLQN